MPDPAKPLVSALIVSRNAKEELLRCLKAFFASADVPVEAIVVDNNSNDVSSAARAALCFSSAPKSPSTRNAWAGSPTSS